MHGISAEAIPAPAPRAPASGVRSATAPVYRADIDGLRGIAVGLVCLFHADVPPFTGGFVGVDVFFVISGFVITRVLRSDLDNGRLSLKGFFIRRVRRLAPALAIVLLACMAVFSVIYPPRYLRELGASLISQSLFVSNIYFWRTSGYFGTPPEVKPLLHTWSLSIEEQFYLIFAAVFVICGRFKQSAFLPLVTAAFCLSLTLSIVATIPQPNASFFLLPTRAWELLAGVLAAVWFDSYHRRAATNSFAANAITAFGLIAIVTSAVLYTTATAFPYVYAILPVAGATALVWSNRPTIVASMLSWGPLVFLGKISYSLYLWHWISIALVRWLTLGAPSHLERVAAILACVPIAYASWRFIESPIRERKMLRTNRAIVVFSVVATSVGALYGFLAYASGGFPSRARSALSGFEPSPQSGREAECFDDTSRGDVRFCQVGSRGPGEVSFIAIGDSHAESLLPALDSLALQHHVKGLFASTSGCLPFLGITPSRYPASVERCRALNDKSLQFAKNLRIRQIVLIARWNYYTEVGPDGLFQAVTNAEHRGISVSESRAAFAEQLRATVEAYGKIGADINVVLQAPLQRTDPEGFLFRRSLPTLLGGLTNRLDGTLDLAQHRRDQQYAERIFRQTSEIRTVDIAPVLCPNSSTCLMFMNGRPLYFDDNHLSVLGAQHVAGALDPIFERIGQHSEQ
jgi:peptidoglycan/LPS O-acetylase OafA/YrhL